LLRLQREQPELLRAPNKVGFVGDCIVARLCGRFTQDATSLSICVLLNPALRQADPDLLRRIGVAPNQLSELLPAREAAGPLTKEAAQATGLPVGIPVSTAVHDQYAAVLGTAAIHRGDVMFGAGTAWVLLAAVAEQSGPVTDKAFFCPHVVDGLYGQLLSLGNGGSSVTWALDQLGITERDCKSLDELLAAAPPGCDGLRFLPPLVSNRGASVGDLATSRPRGHILRAVTEGLACELARHIGFLTSAGMKVDRLVMCGGAAESTVTPRIIANVTGLPVACTIEPEMSALGAAVIARGLIEPATSLAELAESMTSTLRVVTPDGDAGVYSKLLRECLAQSGNGCHLQTLSEAGRGGRGGVRAICPFVTTETKLHYGWSYTDVDRSFWAEHLEEWVPKQIIDAHIHVSDPRHRLRPMTDERRRQYWVSELAEPLPAPDARRCASIVYPGREVTCVAMGSPDLDFDLEAENDYTQRECLQRGWRALVLLKPQWPAERVAAELSRPGVIGVKPYYSLISHNALTRDAHLEASIFDYLPHHALEVLNDRGAWVTLHVPKAERLGHPDNIREIKEIRRKYPRVVLVIAHLGRCYTEPHAQEAFPPLADDPGLYFDNSAVLNPAVHRLALKTFGPQRILYGTDNPVFFMRGRRQWQGRTYINRTNYPFHFNKEREAPEIEAQYTLYMYEALRALKQSCEELGFGRGAVEAIFRDNARRLIDGVLNAKRA
jgi:hypothetical protein